MITKHISYITYTVSKIPKKLMLLPIWRRLRKTWPDLLKKEPNRKELHLAHIEILSPKLEIGFYIVRTIEQEEP